LTAAVEERVRAGAAPVLAVDVYGAAAMLGLGRCSVLALADAGHLPRLRFGRAVRFAVSDVEHLVEQMRAGESLLTGTKNTSAPALSTPGR